LLTTNEPIDAVDRSGKVIGSIDRKAVAAMLGQDAPQ
jgi:hypothetical protein